MSYYTGRGDYYSGKGDFGSILGGIIGTVGKVAGAAIPGVGGLISTGASAIASAISGGSSSPGFAAPSTTTRQTSGIALPFGPTIPQMSGGGGGGCGSSNGGCNSGYHLNKTDHYNRSGFVAAKSTCVRNRKVNYTNPRALSRAAKRMDGFVTVARRALKSTNYKVVNKSYKQNYRKPLKR